MTGHATLQIELSLIRVLPSGSRNPSQAEVVCGKYVHRRVTLIAETALFVAGAATQIGKVSVLPVLEDIVSQMRIEDWIPLMATLAVFGDIVTGGAARFRFDGGQTVESEPVISMVGGNKVLGRFMAFRAFVADQSLAMAIHARGHVREMTGECGLVLGVKILVTDLALNCGGADMSLMTELGTISRYTRAQGGRVAEMADSTFTRFVHAVTVRALCMSGKQIV